MMMSQEFYGRRFDRGRPQSLAGMRQNEGGKTEGDCKLGYKSGQFRMRGAGELLTLKQDGSSNRLDREEGEYTRGKHGIESHD